jgi:hypothetical protein
MDESKALVVFEDKKVRRIRHNNEWYFSVIDIVQVLTNSENPRNYWSMLKKRELDAGIELSTNCVQLKLESSDGKLRETDCANTKSTFRLIQSIPSPKVEPFKQWLAQVGYERIEEIQNPEIGQDRIKEYIIKGFTMDDERLKNLNQIFGQDYFEEQIRFLSTK